MYVFAGVILVGLVVAKFVDLVRGFVEFPRPIRLLLAFLAGLGIAWAADYSMFASWGIELRVLWTVPAAVVLGLFQSAPVIGSTRYRQRSKS
jgi:hypothetical protein